MALYAIGDLHLSLGGSKPMDIFGSAWENHTEKLETNWRSLVKPSDTVVLLGDLSWGISLEESLEDFLFIDSLPGKKYIIKGNHDYYWSTVTKMTAFFELHNIKSMEFLNNNSAVYEEDGVITQLCGTRGWFYDVTGGDKVYRRELTRLSLSLDSAKQEGEKIAFLHYPPVAAGYECTGLTEILEKSGVRRCYYGHLHGKSFRGTDRAFSLRGVTYSLVSADFLKFMPLRIEI